MHTYSNSHRAQRDAQRAATKACGYASAMRVSRVCVAAVWAACELSGSSLQHQRRLGQYVTRCRVTEALLRRHMSSAREQRSAA